MCILRFPFSADVDERPVLTWQFLIKSDGREDVGFQDGSKYQLSVNVSRFRGFLLMLGLLLWLGCHLINKRCPSPLDTESLHLDKGGGSVFFWGLASKFYDILNTRNAVQSGKQGIANISKGVGECRDVRHVHG